MREASYSAPLATHALIKQNFERDGATVRELPRLAFGGAHLDDPERDWRPDVTRRVLAGLVAGVLATALLSAVARARCRSRTRAVARDLAGESSPDARACRGGCCC